MAVDQPADPLWQLLRPERLTAVVDVGANPITGEEPPYRAMLLKGLCTVVGFEPQEGPRVKLLAQKGPLETYLPYAVGDGAEHTFHVCRMPSMSSIFEPDPLTLALFNEFPTWGQVVGTVRIATRRLDDIAEVEDLDLLKIDIQGSESAVFTSGIGKLSRAVAIQAEVSFIPLYRHQPTLGAVDVMLRSLGFIPHCFAELKRWSIAPLVKNNNPRIPFNQLLEADLVYVRDFLRPQNMDAEQWKHLALVAYHCYGSFDLAVHAIRMATHLGALAPETQQSYLDILSTGAPAQAGSP